MPEDFAELINSISDIVGPILFGVLIAQLLTYSDSTLARTH